MTLLRANQSASLSVPDLILLSKLLFSAIWLIKPARLRLSLSLTPSKLLRLHLSSAVAMSSDSPLFTPIRLGDIQLEHRLAMAPLTRFRATEAHVHTDMAVEYYSQRANAPGTLIITEA